MADKDDFNLQLEQLHKSVKVKTKPSKKQPPAVPRPAAQKSKTQKPAPTVPEKESPKIEQKVADELPERPSTPPMPRYEQQETNPEAKSPKTVSKEEVPASSPVYDKTLDRKHKTKNTFNSVFPSYGLPSGSQGNLTETKLMSQDLDKAEPIDWSYHMRTDAIKRYTEEMLKAANMRGGKK